MRSFLASLSRNRLTMCLLAMVCGVLLSASGAYATAPTPAEVVLNPVINTSTFATAIFTIGGAALVAAFGIGGGFRLAKKVYAWMFSKI